MSVVVQKYGGSSLATPEHIKAVAEHVVRTKERGHDVVVVVSAMGETTDMLIGLANAVSSNPSRRELDMLLSVGERISMSLMSMAVEHLGYEAISFTGSQCGIMTNDRHFDARIVEVRPFRVQDELARGRIVIVAGYQGTSYRREVTTLGRGGSDITAVALAAALDAEACEIYSDVDGVYSADPRTVEGARHLDELGYPEMEALARSGAKVLNAQAVRIAREHGIAIYARATGDPEGRHTVVRKDAPTRLTRVTGVTGRHGLVIRREPGPLDEVLDRLGWAGDRILEWRASDGGFEVLCEPEDEADATCCTLTLVGRGIEQDRDLVADLLGLVREGDAEILGMRLGEASVTLCLGQPEATELQRLVHERLVEPAVSRYRT